MSAFDLDSFAPPPITFTHKKREYRVSGDTDVDTIARMLRIESALSEGPETEEIVALVREGRDLILEMVQEYEPDVTELKLGPRDLIIVFSLISHGPSVAAAVAEALSQPTRTDPATGEPVQTADEGLDGEGRDGDVAPLASDTLSSERSSSSDAFVDGLLATGTA